HERDDNDAPYSLDYSAFGIPAAGGEKILVPAEFEFSDDAIGAFHGSTFFATGDRGGKGTVTARAAGFTATTTLTLDIHADFAQDGLSTDIIDDVVSATKDAALAPSWSYPGEGAVIPGNLN